MTSPAICSRCGKQLSTDAPQGLCPQCLLHVGMESNTWEQVDGDASDVAKTESYKGAISSASSTKPTADLPEPGDRFGNFRLIRKLGAGGMGTVFEAEDLDGGRQVALKLLTHSLESREARNRFFREGRLAGSINHPNCVYVYGTVEIEGTPAISMERIAGGTLQDRVRQRGPLGVHEAVDAVLQIIAGLEAAAKVGVLHRDIKPSNCFVDSYETIKIGDFGLSISTSVRGDSHLTEPGAFLGTPVFSSPEQLRGDELDVRSDIYAVGVTLFYLLTGKTPFEADNLVKLLATVLEQPAPSPAIHRRNLPSGLARVVLRCLAKQPSDRFSDYAALRDALVPYDSNAPTPATLALRGAAGICDMLIWSVVILALQRMWFGSFAAMTDPALLQSPGYLGWLGLTMSFYVLYFAVPEGLWGASLGKAICRLRLVDSNRSTIGILRAIARTLIYVAFPSLIIWIVWLCGGPGPFDFETSLEKPLSYWTMMAVSNSYYVMLALLFSTARRHNGYAGLHDLATRSRVILRPAYVKRPALEYTESTLPEPQKGLTIGPYHILDSLEQKKSEEFLLAYDTRLLRRVWIHKLPDGSPSVTSNLRSLGRVGRLRWINGRRSPSDCWDAYEALTGRPLLDVIEQPQPWSKVRYWLMDLSEELSIAEKDGSLPDTLALDRVWITGDGQAKLLDFPAPTTHDPRDSLTSESARLGSCKTPQHFLSHVAESALQADHVPARLPIRAHALIQRLSQAEATSDEAATALHQMIHSIPSVTRRRRATMAITVAAIPMFVAFVSALAWLMMSRWQQQFPELTELHNCLTYMNTAFYDRSMSAMFGEPKASEDKQRAFEIYVAGRFRQIIEDKDRWNSLYGRTIPIPLRAKAQRILEEHRRPTQQEIDTAAATVEPILQEFQQSAALMRQQMSPLAVGALQFVVMWLLLIFVPSTMAAITIRRGLVSRLFGVEYVTSDGVPASRGRMLWRTVVYHAPVLLSPLVLACVILLIRDINAAILLVVSLLLVVTCISLSHTQQGIPDRLSRTYPVPP